MKRSKIIGISTSVVIFGIIAGIASLPDEVLEPTQTLSENSQKIEDKINPDLTQNIEPLVLPEKTPEKEEPTPVKEIEEPTPVKEIEEPKTEANVIKVSVSDGVGARQR